MRNFGIPRVSSPRLVGGNNQAAGSHTAQNTRADNVIRLAGRQPSLPGRLDLASASERGPFIEGGSIDRGEFVQAMLDVLTVCWWLALGLLIAVAAAGSVFAAGWFIFFYL